MRLPHFILANVEPILVAWEDFARSIWPVPLNDPETDPAALRDHAENILRAAAEEMLVGQTDQEQQQKSRGKGEDGAASVKVDRASELHGILRVSHGFELCGVVAEYRALRSSVIRLWRASLPTTDLNDLDDLTRFNETIDQSLAEAVRSYEEQVQRDREELVGREAATRIKDEFLATLSHELRTPLSAIVGWTSILRTAGSNSETLNEGLDVIQRNTEAQVRLIDDILDLSHILSGKVRLDISQCDLFAIITASIDVVRVSADAHDITLDVQLDPAVGAVFCDATRVRQIVWNLLCNAIKFSERGGIVHVRLKREPSAALIEVRDNGQGINPQLLPYIFDRFRQADNSIRRRHGGLGLGLSIVKQLAEMHGGSVEARSQGEGRGATFTVRLPIGSAQVADDTEAKPESLEHAQTNASEDLLLTRLDGLHLLVVDDEPDARRMLMKVLEGVGARVTTAASAADALSALAEAKAKDSSPDVLISDLGMPDQDGYDLIREVRARGYDVEDLPAIALTAFAQDDYARASIAAGFQMHIAKPVNISDLTTAIASLAGRP